MFVIIKSNVITSSFCLGHDTIAIQKQHMDFASVIKDKSGNSISITDSTHCINKTNLWSGKNDDNHINEVVLNDLDRQIKISIVPMQFRPSVKVHFPVEFQVISDMLLFYLFIGHTVDVTKIYCVQNE